MTCGETRPAADGQGNLHAPTCCRLAAGFIAFLAGAALLAQQPATKTAAPKPAKSPQTTTFRADWDAWQRMSEGMSYYRRISRDVHGGWMRESTQPAHRRLLDLAFGEEAKKAFTLKRQEVFEFVTKPRATRTAEGVVIEFESKGTCDVTVAIEDGRGQTIRHLVSGLLGPGAPAPLQKGSLKQHLVWDCKDDFGKPVNPAACIVRVSLGLKARFEKVLHWFPKKKLGLQTAVSADEDGVYVYENNLLDYVRKFDHEGNYVRTLYPFAANQLKGIKGLEWQAFPPDGRQMPYRRGSFFATLLPFSRTLFSFNTDPVVGDIPAAKGMLALLGHMNLARLGTDGTTRGQGLVGPSVLQTIRVDGKVRGDRVPRRGAFSPDGKWLYLARVYLESQGGDPVATWQHEVYRLAFAGDKPPELFLGKVEAGTDNDHFNRPAGVATDAQGRIYVADYGNNRVQVFSPEGKFLHTISVSQPAEVKVHQKTGEIYVFCWSLEKEYRQGRKPTGRSCLRKFSPLDGSGPKVVMEADLTFEDQPYSGFFESRAARAELDSWAKEPTVWLVPAVTHGYGSFVRLFDGLFIFAERDGRLVLTHDFKQECKDAGQAQPVWPCWQRQEVMVDPKREVVYVSEIDNWDEGEVFNRLVAIELKTGQEKIVRLPRAASDAVMDAQGLLYLRVGNAIVRYEPESMKEVPFENRRPATEYKTARGNRPLATQGAIFVVGAGGGSITAGKQPSFGVSPQGDVIVGDYIGGKLFVHHETFTFADGTQWTPELYPGRRGGHYIHVFDRTGKPKFVDVMKGVGILNGGLDLDAQGNAYVAVRDRRVLDGRPFGHLTWGNGALLKFPVKDIAASRFYSDYAPAVEVPLATKPDRPKELEDRWVDGAEWIHPGAPTSSQWRCWCRTGRFKTDAYGRSFVPEAWRFDVAVVDPAGNLVLRIGQYGNADSAGPASAVPLGGDEVGLFDARYVTTQTDKRLIIADVGNGRIVSAKLDYHATERVPLK